ncbi:MAG: hypothetical protein U5N53_11145 [Mycobacterium sp.]|nr:hypothetical protein [Mycobacterium sp.]
MGGVLVDAISVGSYTKGSAGTPKATSHSIEVNGDNPNRLLLAAYTTSSGSAVTPAESAIQITTDVGAATLTQVATSQQQIPTNLGSVQWRYLLAPADGLHTVTANYNGAGWLNGVGMVLISLYGVDQAAPFGTPVKSSGNNQVVANSVTADVGDLILWALAHSASLTGLTAADLISNLGASDSGYGDYTTVRSAAGTGSAVALASGNNSVHACSGLAVLAA